MIVDEMRLYGRYAAMSLRAQMQYRASFVMLTIGHLLMTVNGRLHERVYHMRLPHHINQR